MSLISLAATPPAAPTQTPPEKVLILNIHGGIGPAVQAYVEQGLAAAAEQNAKAVILKLDTPGGLASSMRGIIQALLNSKIPVLSYVAPSGARAASAGTFIVYAGAFAAMAPGTHLGAATPVSLGGGSKDKPSRSPFPGTEPNSPQDQVQKPAQKQGQAPSQNQKPTQGANQTKAQTSGQKQNNKATTAPTSKPKAVDQSTAMREKVTNDAVASIRSLAQLHGRNVDFAERAVTEAATLTANEALQQNVINAIANDIPELIKKANGQTMIVANKKITFQLDDYRVIPYEATWKIKLLTVITAPSIAYFLLIAGIYGLFFEFTNPGIILPGVIGGISLILGVYALQLLPLSYAGLSLLILGIAFMIGEAMMPSIGVLGIGGVIAFAIGSLMLIDTEHPSFHVAKSIIFLLSLLSAVFFIFIGRMALRTRKQPLVSGRSTLIGQVTTVQKDSDGRFFVFLESEHWQVTSQVPLQNKQKVTITAAEGVTLRVKPASDEPPASDERPNHPDHLKKKSK